MMPVAEELAFDHAENRPLTTVDSQQNLYLNFKPCFIWLVVRKRIIRKIKYLFWIYAILPVENLNDQKS